jgi:alpha-glucoside transport system substrate-binding protein
MLELTGQTTGGGWGRYAEITMLIAHQTATRPVGLFVLVAAFVFGCGGPDGTPAVAVTGGTSSTAAQGLRGAHVHVLGLWSGPEFDSFETVKSAWEEETGAIVDWEATDDLPGALADHKRAGDLPDIAILPNLALMEQLAEDGELIPLDAVLDMKAVTKDYTPAWTALGSHKGKLYGIFYKVTNKAAVWYNPKAFAAAGYDVPATWTELITLADKMVADGHSAFSVVGPRGPANGWALTDWISEIVLSACGPDIYDKWIAADIPWNQACIKESFDTFARIVSTDGYVLGGSERIVATADDVGADPLYTEPPTAYLYPFASFAQAFIAASHPDLEPGTDYDVFRFPTIDPKYQGAVTIGADVPVMVSDSPAARSFMTYLASARAQETWIKLGGFTSVNRSVPVDTYVDPVARKLAEALTTSEVSRFSAGDMMPASLQRAWWAAMLELVKDPAKVDSILDELTAAAKTAR